jgi:hypothetical protein
MELGIFLKKVYFKLGYMEYFSYIVENIKT